MKKRLISILLALTILLSSIQPTQALIDPISVSAETYALVILAGKVYAIGSKVVSASNALAKREATKSISKESEQTIQSFINTMGEQAEAAAQEAYSAKTEEEARQASNKEAQLREMQRKYNLLLQAQRENTALVVKQIAVNEAKSQATGYVTGMVKGEAGKWTANQALGTVGQELTKEGSEFVNTVIDLSDGAMAGASQFENGLNGQIPTEISPADADFMQALMDVKSTSIEAAITKAEWDKFVKETAKEEFKEYLKGNSGNFTNLPLSVQERYWHKFLFMTPSDFDHINKIMTGARYNNDYAYALKRIMSEFPDYAEFFKNLNKDILNKDAQLKEEIEKFLQELKATPTSSANSTPSPQPSPSELPKPQLQHRQVTGRGSWGGNHYTVTFHSAGGSLNGSFSGKCSGGVSGTFDGGDNGRIKGRISGRYKVDTKGNTAPGSGSFSGTVYLTKGYASGRWSGSSAGENQGGSWKITFTPIEEKSEESKD